MMAEADPCPLSAEHAPVEISVRSDPDLVADGWVRRHLSDAARAQEAVALYESLGFEVRTRTLSPTDLGPVCESCAACACPSFVVIYTRKTTRHR